MYSAVCDWFLVPRTRFIYDLMSLTLSCDSQTVVYGSRFMVEGIEGPSRAGGRAPLGQVCSRDAAAAADPTCVSTWWMVMKLM